MNFLPLKDYKPSEKEITREIRAYLKIRGIFHWKAWQGLGSTPGCPDIIGIHKGRMIGIEVKATRGKVTEIQQQFLDRINGCGGIAFVARSVEDVEKGLNCKI